MVLEPFENLTNLVLDPLLKVIFVPFFTYDELVTLRVHPQQHKQTANITTMVMELLATPVVWIL
jgi:hypothetical protein